jgi:hypothetical protein
MDKMLSPVFDDDAVAGTRWFFTEYVLLRSANGLRDKARVTLPAQAISADNGNPFDGRGNT